MLGAGFGVAVGWRGGAAWSVKDEIAEKKVTKGESSTETSSTEGESITEEASSTAGENSTEGESKTDGERRAEGESSTCVEGIAADREPTSFCAFILSHPFPLPPFINMMIYIIIIIYNKHVFRGGCRAVVGEANQTSTPATDLRRRHDWHFQLTHERGTAGGFIFVSTVHNRGVCRVEGVKGGTACCGL